MKKITREQIERKEREYRAARENLADMRDDLIADKREFGVQMFSELGVEVGDKCKIVFEINGYTRSFDREAFFMGYSSKWGERVEPILKKVKKDGTASQVNARIPLDFKIEKIDREAAE